MQIINTITEIHLAGWLAGWLNGSMDGWIDAWIDLES